MARDTTGCDPRDNVSLGREVESQFDALQVDADRLRREIEPMSDDCGLESVTEKQGDLTLAGCQSPDRWIASHARVTLASTYPG